MEDKEIKTLMNASGLSGKHNWMYSFMVARFYDFDNIYLVAYCKQCDQTMTVIAPRSTDGTVKLQRVGVPKYGCEWVE